ncbi:hypothetical protein B0J11DRAFT_209285 [Dendryphion nanum]|uniref:Uncharacterized protein n=1 Tax=Dendryphion nanum TaxID=256645 RepID=A0A9P9E6J1_9PLEO|nr:hypothetical protein B0J11DRAFT_209285 [Dendryphion nanum]
MVNEDVKQPPASNSGPRPPSASENVPGDSGPTLVKTGEIMLVFAMVIIFLVILFVSCHLIMKSRGGVLFRRRKKEKKQPKKDIEAQPSSELHSADKKVFEVQGTQVVLCELPEAPPLQEMEANTIFTPIERTMTDTSTLNMEVSPAENPWPEGRELAVYWSMRL